MIRIASPDRVIGQGKPAPAVEDRNQKQMFGAGVVGPDVSRDMENVLHHFLRLGKHGGVDRLQDEAPLRLAALACDRIRGIDQTGGELLVVDHRSGQDET